MIELNPEQRQAMAQGEAVRIIDPVDARYLRLGPGRGIRTVGWSAATTCGTARSGDSAPDAPLATSVLAGPAPTAEGQAESWQVGGIPRGGAYHDRSFGCRSLSGMFSPRAETW